jgi:hypothetical protein
MSAEVTSYKASISLDLMELGTSAQCQVYELLLSAKNLLNLEISDEDGYNLINWQAEIKGRPFHKNVIAGYALLRMAQLLLNDVTHNRVIITDSGSSDGTTSDNY